MVEMSIYGVSFDLVGKQPIVLLKTSDGNRYLPIWIGHPGGRGDPDEAPGRDRASAADPRPAREHPQRARGRGVRVTVTELRENTFHASITVQHNGSELEIDSRSSDAIAVAVRAQVPIYAADEVIEESAIEFEGEDVSEEDIVDEFKRFLDRVSAEDFAEAEAELEADRRTKKRRGRLAISRSEMASARTRSPARSC